MGRVSEGGDFGHGEMSVPRGGAEGEPVPRVVNGVVAGRALGGGVANALVAGTVVAENVTLGALKLSIANCSRTPWLVAFVNLWLR